MPFSNTSCYFLCRIKISAQALAKKRLTSSSTQGMNREIGLNNYKYHRYRFCSKQNIALFTSCL